MPKRAKRVRHKDHKPDDEVIEYPGPDELNEPPDSIDDCTILIFGPKGEGKSTALASFPDSLTLQLESKRRGLRIRQAPIQKYTAKQILEEDAPDSWTRIKNTTQQWVDDESILRLNFDSVDMAYEMCYASVCAENRVSAPKDAGRESFDIWNQIRDEFSAYFDAVKDTGIKVTFSSHVKEREEKDLVGGKMKFVQPSCQPACLKYLMQTCDIVIMLGKYNGYRAALVRDDTNLSFVSPGIQGRFYQPDNKPLFVFELPDLDLEPEESHYKRFVEAFNNKLWDMDTPDDERKVEKKKVVKKGPKKPK